MKDGFLANNKDASGTLFERPGVVRPSPTDKTSKVSGTEPTTSGSDRADSDSVQDLFGRGLPPLPAPPNADPATAQAEARGWGNPAGEKRPTATEEDRARDAPSGAKGLNGRTDYKDGRGHDGRR